MSQASDRRSLELMIDGNDISPYVGEWARCKEDRVEWTVHTELIRNEETSAKLRPLKDKHVQVTYRMKSPAGPHPWRSGLAVMNWRLNENGGEEIILHGLGRLNKAKSNSITRGSPIPVKVTQTTSIGGIVTEQDEGIGTITLVEEDPQDVATREEQIQRISDAEIQAITSPTFILFLANSALSSYRCLHSTGLSTNSDELLYSSLTFLPLAVEYYMKYLLVRIHGNFKGEFKNYKLLKLFDFLPFDVQRSVEREFEIELENYGRKRESQDLRVFLMRSQNAFTAIRYLFVPLYASTSRHLIKPDNIAVLTCVANAVERVSKQT